MALLKLLSARISIYAQPISMRAIYVDMGFNDNEEKRRDIMENYFNQCNVEGEVIQTTIGPYSHSDANSENPCFLCSRIKRKKIFAAAEKFECNKIVFGHHKDDIVETLLLNMIYGRQISAMPPSLSVINGKYLIQRPLYYVEEVLLKRYCEQQHIPVVDQECPTDGNSQRQYVKELVMQLDSDIKGARDNIFASMKRVKLDYLP